MLHQVCTRRVTSHIPYVYVLQCVAVCCRVLLCVAGRQVTSHTQYVYVLQCVANVLQRVALCCRKTIHVAYTLCICVAVCCRGLQCVAVCCSALQCVAVCCSVLQSVAECCRVLQSVAVCCVVLQDHELHRIYLYVYVLQCFAVLQCVAVCCSMLLNFALCCRKTSHVAHISGCVALFAAAWTARLRTATHCNTLQHKLRDESCRTYESVMSHVYVSHVTNMN